MSKKRSRNPQHKHRFHNCEIVPTTVAHHKFVVRCVDCGGAYVKWATADEDEAYRYLRKFGRKVTPRQSASETRLTKQRKE